MLIFVLRRPKQRALEKLSNLRFIAENCRRSAAGEELLVDRRKEFWMKCGCLFPPLYPNPKPPPRNAYERMFRHGTKENDVCRIVLSFLICEFVGILFFVSTALKYSTFPSRLGVYISIIVQCVLGLMIPFPSVRATVLIAMTKLTTSRLRSIILMFLITWAFQVPAMNTTRNLEMLAESVACVRDSAIQIGNTLISEANMQSNKFTMEHLEEQARFFVRHLANFRDTIRRLQDVVVKFGKQAKDYLVQLLTVKEYCQRFFVGPYYFCIRIFDDGAQECDRLTMYRGMPMCRFVKDMKEICNAARFGELVCVIPDKIKESLKSGFLAFTKDQMKAALSSVMDGYNISFLVREAKAAKKTWEDLGISINHTFEGNQTQTFQIDKMKEELEQILNRFKIFVDILSTAVKVIISNMIIFTFLSAALYALKYKRKERVDNFYITEEFRNVDLLREAQGQPSLLPLLPKERKLYIEGFTFHMTAKEKMRLLFAFTLTLTGGFLPIFLVLLDLSTYQMLYFTYSFLHSNATRTDRLDFYNLKAAGEGFIASFLQRILQIFNPITGSQHSDDDWRRCFSEPNPPDFLLIRLLFLLYILALVLCIAQIYVARLRHLVAQHYWPERTKPRTLWLYNQVLEGRKNVLSQMVKAAKEKELREELAEDEMTGRGQLVNRGLPVLGSDQYLCTRCFRPDLAITDASNTRICPNCNSLYCTDCYAIRKKCLECDASLQAVLNEVEFYVDSSSEEDEGYSGPTKTSRTQASSTQTSSSSSTGV